MSTHSVSALAGKPPLITVIVALLNNAGTIQQCIDSVSSQTYPRTELIIMDGGSTDGCVEILQANQQRIAYWESSPDRGVYHAWNKALQHATGDWICFLGADDYFWDKHVLELMAGHVAAAYPTYRVVYGRLAIVNVGGEYIYVIGEPWQEVEKMFLQLMSIPHVGTMHHRSLFEDHGRFDESFRISGDYEFLRRELRTGRALFVPDVVVAAMRQGGISSDPRHAFLQLSEARRARAKQGDHSLGRHWVMAYIRILLRTILWRLAGEHVARKALDLARRVMGKPAHWTRT